MFLVFLFIIFFASQHNFLNVSAATEKRGSGKTEDFDSVSSWISHYGSLNCYLRIVFDRARHFDFAFLHPRPKFPVELTLAGLQQLPNSRYDKLKRRDHSRTKKIRNWPCEATMFFLLPGAHADHVWLPEYDLRQAASVDLVLCSIRHIHLVMLFSEIEGWASLLLYFKQTFFKTQYDFSRVVSFSLAQVDLTTERFQFVKVDYLMFCLHCETHRVIAFAKRRVSKRVYNRFRGVPNDILCRGCNFEEARKLILQKTVYIAKKFPKLYQPDSEGRDGAAADGHQELSRAERVEFGKEGASYTLLKEIYHSLTNYTVKESVKRKLQGYTLDWAPDPELHFKQAPSTPQTTHLPTKTDHFNFITCAKKPQELVMSTYLEPFEGRLWFWFLLVNILCAIFIIYVFKHHSDSRSKDKEKSSIGRISLLCLAVLLEKGEMVPDFESKLESNLKSKVRGHIFRVSLVLWILSGIVLSNSYKGKLTSDLTAGNAVGIYETFEELGQAEFRLYSAFVQFTNLKDPNSRAEWLFFLIQQKARGLDVERILVHEDFIAWTGVQGEEYFRFGAKMFDLIYAVGTADMYSIWDEDLITWDEQNRRRSIVRQVKIQIMMEMAPITKLLAVPPNFPLDTPEQMASTCQQVAYVDYESDLKKFVPQPATVLEAEDDQDSGSDIEANSNFDAVADPEDVIYTKGKEHYLPENVGFSVVDAYKGGEYLADFIKRFSVESGIHNWLSDRLPAVDKKSLEFIWNVQEHKNQEARPLSASTNLVQTNFIIYLFLSILSFVTFIAEIYVRIVQKLYVNFKSLKKRERGFLCFSPSTSKACKMFTNAVNFASSERKLSDFNVDGMEKAQWCRT